MKFIQRFGKISPMLFFQLMIKVLYNFPGVFLFYKPTPTFENPFVGEETSIHPPFGWTIAGFLLILLVSMLYSQIKKGLRQLFLKRKKKSSGG
ncbi:MULTISPECIES: hypothetical protein [Anaerolinea]|uniref:Uncharacterized protein n=1 Tax=Anaerolinea thermophila (strain DSM 14523 / JCM 11388 / NBRC 100420 / UNI-1) TaxID=926569 RepID=E8N562_ANATU|nr:MULTISPECIES: hypothetical protein [Anaerolinea]BAJ63576.1 hypothetical protein ANT_15480 [Anaerolinea thermophila UNI-1]